MSFLRRRLFGGGKEIETPTTRPGTPEIAEEVRLAPVSKIIGSAKQKSHEKGKKRLNGFVFVLGGLFGIVVAGFFAGKNDLIDFPEFADLSLDSIIDVLPAGFVKDVQDLMVGFLLIQGRLERERSEI